MRWHYYDGLKNYSASIRASQNGLKIDDKLVWIRANLGLALLHNGKFGEAQQEYTTVLDFVKKGTYSDPENKVDLIEQRVLEDLFKAQEKADKELKTHIDSLVKLIEDFKSSVS